MGKIFWILFAIVFISSCKKDNIDLLSEYHDVVGTWNTQSISWDSLGTRVTHVSPYDVLVIHSDLSYAISMDLIYPVEDGTINIIEQKNDKLEVYFAAKYPSYSSFAGSHIFGMSNVVLISLSGDEMVFRSVDQSFYPDMEFRFTR
jgi:hypothetical protein